MKSLLLIALFVLATDARLSASATGTITGTVVDSQAGEVIVGANVYIEETMAGGTTDRDGVFAIQRVPPGTVTVVASFIGYERERKTVTVASGETVSISFSLASKLLEVPAIELTGERIEQIQRIPGSAVVVSEAKLSSVSPASANEVFRLVPGITVRDEEGQGLRPNIGIRGLDPTRSRNVLVLEDGIPIALGPYGDPGLYYNPPIDRMRRIEIVKGSGSIMFGPQTVGGVINYITRQPPRQPTFSARVQGGSNHYYSGLFSYGGTWNNVGVDAMYLHKQGSGLRDNSDFDIRDLTTQWVFGLTPASRLGVKINLYDETSQSTYLGLTQAMFDANPHQNPALHDRMAVRRYAVSATHQQVLGNDLLLTTTVYANNAVRNWRRQDYDRDDRGRIYERVLGDIAIPGGALFMRNSTGNRNREFTVYGMEPRLQVIHRWSGFPGELDLGARIHFEDMHILRINGTNPTALSGTITEDELRETQAVSGFVKNRLILHEGIDVTAGVRVERLHFTRIFRRGVVDGVLTDIHRKGTTRSTAVIPGVGLTYKPSDAVTLFTGLHRGFSPPRVQDAIDNDARSAGLDAEKSWNYELGIRTTPLRWMYGEVTAYYLDFHNQIVPASAAGGIDTRFINAGETKHKGFEASGGIDLGLVSGYSSSLLIEGSVTLSDASFSSGPYRNNRLPHAPEYLYSVGVRYRRSSGFDIGITGFYSGDQFVDRANTVAGSADGEVGLIPAYHVWDLSANYELPWIDARVSGAVKNVFDNVYIASRAPRGIFPGPFRQVNAGLRWEL